MAESDGNNETFPWCIQYGRHTCYDSSGNEPPPPPPPPPPWHNLMEIMKPFPSVSSMDVTPAMIAQVMSPPPPNTHPHPMAESGGNNETFPCCIQYGRHTCYDSSGNEPPPPHPTKSHPMAESDGHYETFPWSIQDGHHTCYYNSGNKPPPPHRLYIRCNTLSFGGHTVTKLGL